MALLYLPIFTNYLANLHMESNTQHEARVHEEFFSNARAD